jgi:3-hydroxy acid dehydrogenase / malonic semialdehyde reductase
MQNFHQRSVLITGASSGIGRSVALVLAGRGARLFLLARREAKLQALKSEIEALHGSAEVEIIVADVNDPNLPAILQERLGGQLHVLVNNAGLALGRDPVEGADFSDLEIMINTNVVANFRVVHAVLPWMLRDREGDIINLCSIAGLYTYPGGAVYCATKHAVHAFTRVLREETAGRNIRVMQISPGMVETDFSRVRFKGDEVEARAVYAGMKPLTPEDIARMMLFMLEQPRHVVIDELITMPAAQGSPTTVQRTST